MAFDSFIALVEAEGLPAPLREYAFAPGRKFRADYCWLAQKVIVEVNGGVWRRSGKGAHTGGTALLRDYQKANLAQCLGYRYLQYTPEQMRAGFLPVRDLRQLFG